MPVVTRKSAVRRRHDYKRPDRIARTLNIQEFYEKRNKILITRGCGGLGDILIHRMIFEDLKLLIPDAEIHFACPYQYHDALTDHPHIDKILSLEEANRHEYVVSYNTTTACGRYEMKMAPFSGKHRSDIWANHCGFELNKHDMHFNLTDQEKKNGKDIIEKNRDRTGPSVAVCPISAMQNKNLLDHQLIDVMNGLRDRGCYAFGLHSTPISTLVNHKMPTVYKLGLRPWLSVINQVDYVVSVDTAHFHCAGGMGKPLTGIFTFVDGLVYGKYFDCEIVQKHRSRDPKWTCGPCYNWGACPKTKENPKPCLTELTSGMIMEGIDKMFEKWPIINSI